MSSLAARAGADLKAAGAGGGRLRSERAAQRRAQSAERTAQRQREAPPTGAAGASRAGRRAWAERAEPGSVSGPLPESPFPRRAPPASMRLLTAALLLLLLALYAARVDGESPSLPGEPKRQTLGLLGPRELWVGTEGGRGAGDSMSN